MVSRKLKLETGVYNMAFEYIQIFSVLVELQHVL